MHKREAIKRLRLTHVIKKLLLVVTVIIYSSCQSNQPDALLQAESLSKDESEQVDLLLNNLYQSFSYRNGTEPDWELMRSVFIEGAQFVLEVPAGASPTSQTIEEFISGWQKSIRESSTPAVETSERIISTKAEKVGKLIRVDVVFLALKSNDTSPRKPGLDSLILANVNGEWKILSFVIHYESKL